MKICFATTECVPFAKTGGLADVSGALPKALAALGADVKVFLPLYHSIPVFDYGFEQLHDLDGIPVQIGHRTIPFNTWRGRLPGSAAEVYLIDCPHYFHRASIYDGAHADEDERFILFQHAILNVLQRLHWAPDVLHANDWATALLPVFLRTTYAWDALFAGTATFLSIHNIGYQGRFTPHSVFLAGLSYEHLYPGGPYELDGAFCFLKAGIVFTDLVGTVSPTYAREIQTPEHGADLDGILRARRDALFGVLNGIDPDVWNPATDPHLATTYDAASLDRKEANKQALLEEVGLPYEAGVPAVGLIARLTAQKGVELLQPILQPLVEERAVQFVFLGSGEPRFEDFFRWAAATYPDRVAAYIGYNDGLAHRIEAGCDAFVMPSRYEPCGLNQMYSLAYGTVPVVRATGGLADTVRDNDEHRGEGNGYSCRDFAPFALHDALRRALGLYAEPEAWRALQQRGMAQDFSWDVSARRYVQLYRHAIGRRRGAW